MTERTPDDARLRAAPPPRRRRFLLGRLGEAVRRQDWFTVLVEITIVVLGVVIGFQITAWGQGRADRAKEQAYLRQLAADLRETERVVARADSASLGSDIAAAALLRAFRAPEPPPADTLLAWAGEALVLGDAQPVMGTAEALIATGDLRLIRNDSLRTLITSYVESMRAAAQHMQSVRETSSAAADGMIVHVDPIEAMTLHWGPALWTSETAEWDGLSPMPEGGRRSVTSFSARDFLGDPAAYRAVVKRWAAHTNRRHAWEAVVHASQEVRVRVEAEIDP